MRKKLRYILYYTMSFKFFISLFLACFSTEIIGQFNALIDLVDEQNTPVSGATIRRLNHHYFQVADLQGKVNWSSPNNEDTILINHIGYKPKTQILTGDLKIEMESLVTELPEAHVNSSWVDKNSFVVHTTLNSKEIEKKQLVQDIPFLLQNLPSTVSSSDAGNGIGYTGIRIRGLDPTQINVLINGVPLNDAESQGVFWVDLPDIIASASEIQVQRGIGLSGSGQVAFGSSILINTNKFNASPYLNVETGIGSFSTFKSMVEAGTGTLKGNWNISGRLSHISSNGFIDRAKANLWSGNISVSKIETKRTFRLHVFDGLEKTYQAWYGAPVQFINMGNRKYNAAGTEKKDRPYENQIDYYRQTHFQFLYSEHINSGFSIHNTMHYTPGYGYYEEYKANQNPEEYFLPSGILTDIVRRRILDNDYAGSIHSLELIKGSHKYQAGISWNLYSGKHFGKVIESGGVKTTGYPKYYSTDGLKRTAMAFGKGEVTLKKFLVTLDLQFRMLSYTYAPEINDQKQKVNHHFFNPKIGFSFMDNNDFQLFGFSGIANREPNRDDYVRAGNALPSPENLWDNELGIRTKGKKVFFEQNFYYMKYKNQLIPTGKLNDVGAYIRSNVTDSYRLGSETSLNYKPGDRLHFDLNLSISRNKTKELIEYIDNWDLGEQETIRHTNKDISFSPHRIFNITGVYKIIDQNHGNLDMDFSLQSISKQYLDGTQNQASVLKPYSVSNIGISYAYSPNGSPRVDIKLTCLNLFDKKFESNGWIYRFNSPSYNPVPDDPYAQAEQNNTYSLKGLFPQAGRNFMISLKWRIISK